MCALRAFTPRTNAWIRAAAAFSFELDPIARRECSFVLVLALEAGVEDAVEIGVALAASAPRLSLRRFEFGEVVREAMLASAGEEREDDDAALVAAGTVSAGAVAAAAAAAADAVLARVFFIGELGWSG